MLMAESDSGGLGVEFSSITESESQWMPFWVCASKTRVKQYMWK